MKEVDVKERKKERKRLNTKWKKERKIERKKEREANFEHAGYLKKERKKRMFR